jgi:hypothetical protein
VSNALKLIIIVATLMIAWRRRNMDSRGLFGSIAYVWLVSLSFPPVSTKPVGAVAKFGVSRRFEPISNHENRPLWADRTTRS